MPFWDRLVNRRRWAATGVVSEPTTAQADVGFSFLGANPPSVELFNAIFQNLDDKDNWLYTRLQEVMQAGGVSPSEAGTNQLLTALRNIWNIGYTYYYESGAFIVPQGVTRVKVQCWGGGGGGGGAFGAGGAGTGGGGGGYTAGLCTVTPGQSIYVTVGKGGLGAPAGAIYSAQPGGTTSFGGYMSASGGAAGVGGDRIIASGPVVGGNGFGGQITAAGTVGGYGMLFLGTDNSYNMGGGIGGSAPFGGSMAHMSISNNGNHGVFPGGGGSGAGARWTGGGWGGGNGANGLCVIEW